MKKLLLLSVLSFANLNCLPNLQDIKNKIDNLTIGSLGTLKLKPEDEKFVRDIIDELGMSQDIRVYKGGSVFNKTFGENNACAISGCNQYIFIGEKLLTQLTDEEKRFLIGHELMHLYHDHLEKREYLNLASYASVLASTAAVYKFRKTYDAENSNSPIKTLVFDESKKNIGFTKMSWNRELLYKTSLLLPAIVSTGNHLLSMYVYRKQESEADRDSVKKLNCANGGIAFLERAKKIEQQSNAKIHKVPEYLSTHPELDARIEAIKKLDKND